MSRACTVQNTVDTPGPVYPRNGTTPTDEQLASVVGRAHAIGISVLFRPCVDPVRAGVCAVVGYARPLVCLVAAKL
jgi:hypothetical protein